MRGRGVGGSAAINSMVAMVGEPDDYDEWERVYGCTGWSWRDVRPWFRRVALPRRRPRRRDLGPLAAAVLASAPGAERAWLQRSRDGNRASVKEVYIDRARSRGDLRVHPDSLVDRVLLDGSRAVGVRLANGEVIEAGLVVVCAGALHSPAVLLRSGVDRMGIGHGLHDHPSLSLSLQPHASTTPSPLAVSVLVHGSHRAPRDMQVVAFDGVEGMSLMAAGMRVHSRGRVRLASSDPHINPTVEFNMLDDERDVHLMRAAAREATRVAHHPAVSSVATSSVAPATDEELRGVVGDYFHAAGSCRMGAADDAMAVVDSRCRAIGYQSLVVCDASVMPNLPRANPCLPTVMIAERVAAMLQRQFS